MPIMKSVHWQDGDALLGYLLDYPDYWTQGDSLEELKDHLVNLYRDLARGEFPGIRNVDELVVPCSESTWFARSRDSGASWSATAGDT